MKDQAYINSTIVRIINCLKKIKYTVDIKQRFLKMIDDSSSFMQLQDLIGEINLTKQQKADIFFKAFLVKQQPEFMFKAGDLAPSYHFYAWVTKTLIDSSFDSFAKRNFMEEIKKWETKNTKDFFSNLALTKEDIEHFSDLIPQNKINQFNQSLKEDLDSQNKVKNYNISVGWHNDNIDVSLKKVSEIGDFESGKLYGYLPPEFDDDQWNDALDKGFAARAKGNNGVKLLEKKLLELKIKGNDRLYTSKVYKNDHGDYLAIFDHKTNHDGINRAIKNIKEIEFEYCDYPNDTSTEINGAVKYSVDSDFDC